MRAFTCSENIDTGTWSYLARPRSEHWILARAGNNYWLKLAAVLSRLMTSAGRYPFISYIVQGLRLSLIYVFTCRLCFKSQGFS